MHCLRSILCFSTLLLGACADRPATLAPDESGAAKVTLSAQRAGGSRAVVMTRNVYLGADIDPIVAETDPNRIPLRVAQAWGTIQANNFPERAQAIAAEIAAVQPHLIGLQEVALYRLQHPGDILQGNPQAAETVVLDYLAILLEALRAQGLEYRPVALSNNADVELPLPVSTDLTVPLADLRFTDRDVILARADVRVGNPQNGHFAARVELSVGGLPVVFTRGWTAVDCRIAGRAFRLVNTHLEGRSGGRTEPIQVEQAAELEQLTRDLALPVVLVGDLNSPAAGSGAPGISYGNLLEAGFVDLWPLAQPGEDGLTADHPKDLRGTDIQLNRRIDLILVRPTVGRRPTANGVQPIAGVVGDEAADRTPSGLWPSDHAGVWAAFRLKWQR